jgi:hypothetical protein
MHFPIFNDCVWNIPRAQLFRKRRVMSAFGKNKQKQCDNGTGNVSLYIRFGASFVFDIRRKK